MHPHAYESIRESTDKPLSELGARPILVIVPGKGGSESTHWQSWLESQYDESVRIEQADWDRPVLDEWAAAILRGIVRLQRPLVFAAHSFGCLALAEAMRLVASHGSPNQAEDVRGALLVAPASPLRFALGSSRMNFALPCRSILVTSQNDPWMGVDEYAALLGKWGSNVVDLGKAGHINTAAGYGPWTYGKQLVDTMIYEDASALSQV